MWLGVDVFKSCAQEVPQWNSISISGDNMREAGATAVQELAFTFANAIAYVKATVDAGLNVDDFAPRLHTVLNQAFHQVLDPIEVETLISYLERIEAAANNCITDRT